jgi:hypothetical protein
MDKAWKREERIVAKAFNSSRALMKGTDEKSDIQHDLFCIDCKLRQNWQVENWFRELQDYAKVEICGLRIIQQPKQRPFVHLPMTEYLKDGEKCYAPLVRLHDAQLVHEIKSKVRPSRREGTEWLKQYHHN